jgi:hypothetical protein
VRSHHIAAPRVPSADRARPGPGGQRRDVAEHEPRRTASESILELQRTAGNHVVRRLLLAGSPVVAAAPVVQRRAYGLENQTSQNTYVDAAVKLCRTRPGMSVRDFVDATLQTIAGELKANGVPLFSWTFVSGAGAAGVFDSEAWAVKVNISKFSSRVTPTVLRDLTLDEITEVVGTLYHESRHTDQDVLIIRSLLDQKKTPKQIHAETKIRKDVITAVSATTYAAPLDADQIAHAGRMYDVMYGAHKEFLEFLIHHSDAYDGLDSLSAPTSTPSAAAAHIATLAAWRSAGLQPHVKRMTAIKRRTSTDTALLQRLQAVDGSLSALMTVWKRVTGAKKPAQADLDSLRDLAGDARDAIAATYVNLEGELDAFRVEAQVKAGFTKKVATRP